MPQAPEPAPPAAPDPAAAGGPAPGAGFLDRGPCAYPGCPHVGLRVGHVLCLTHTAAVLTEGLSRERAAAAPTAPGVDPPGAEEAQREAEVLAATRRRRWWREDDPHYVRIAQLCLKFYRKQGWPIEHHPTGKDIAPLLANAENEAMTEGYERAVYDRFRTASKRAKRRVGYKMARADALAEFEAERGQHAGADYAQIA